MSDIVKLPNVAPAVNKKASKMKLPDRRSANFLDVLSLGWKYLMRKRRINKTIPTWLKIVSIEKNEIKTSCNCMIIAEVEAGWKYLL